MRCTRATLGESGRGATLDEWTAARSVDPADVSRQMRASSAAGYRRRAPPRGKPKAEKLLPPTCSTRLLRLSSGPAYAGGLANHARWSRKPSSPWVPTPSLLIDGTRRGSNLGRDRRSYRRGWAKPGRRTRHRLANFSRGAGQRPSRRAGAGSPPVGISDRLPTAPFASRISSSALAARDRAAPAEPAALANGRRRHCLPTSHESAKLTSTGHRSPRDRRPSAAAGSIVDRLPFTGDAWLPSRRPRRSAADPEAVRDSALRACIANAAQRRPNRAHSRRHRRQRCARSCPICRRASPTVAVWQLSSRLRHARSPRGKPPIDPFSTDDSGAVRRYRDEHAIKLTEVSLREERVVAPDAARRRPRALGARQHVLKSGVSGRGPLHRHAISAVPDRRHPFARPLGPLCPPPTSPPVSLPPASRIATVCPPDARTPGTFGAIAAPYRQGLSRKYELNPCSARADGAVWWPRTSP
jgi:hypothetical protein